MTEKDIDDPSPGPLASRLVLSGSDILAEAFGEEIVAIHLGTGRYYSMRGLAGALWRDVLAGHRPEDLVAALGPALADRARAFLLRLVEEGLVVAGTGDGTPGTAPESPGLAADGADRIELESFDDMADLIQADPIHEVDEEAGWPVRRPDSDQA